MCPKRTWLLRSMVPAMVLGLAAIGMASEKEIKAASSGRFTPELLNTNALIGAKVVNAQGENLGKIDDIVLNRSLDGVSYAAIGFGGVLGIGEKYFAVPWDALTIRCEGAKKVEKVVLDVPRKKFESSQGFKTNDWPAHGNLEWWKSGSMHQEQMAPSAGTKQGVIHEHMKYRRITELVGLNVRNLQGRKLGDIENVVLDLHEGRPVYADLSFGGFLDLGERMAYVPWSALDIRPRLGTARLNADRNLLDAIAYKQGNAPDLANLDQAKKLYARFHEEPYWEVYGYVGSTGEAMHRTPSAEAWKPGSKYNGCFDPKTVITLSGTVESVGSFRPADHAVMGRRLRIKTDEGKTATIYAGPERYVARQGFSFHYGDRIQVTGSKTKVDGRSVIMATQIQRDKKTLELRDSNGKPKWSPSDL
jgi:sporulation protein YlmC with PRC-barrel domain